MSEVKVEIKTNAKEVMEEMNELVDVVDKATEKIRELNRKLGIPECECSKVCLDNEFVASIIEEVNGKFEFKEENYSREGIKCYLENLKESDNDNFIYDLARGICFTYGEDGIIELLKDILIIPYDNKIETKILHNVFKSKYAKILNETEKSINYMNNDNPNKIKAISEARLILKDMNEELKKEYDKNADSLNAAFTSSISKEEINKIINEETFQYQEVNTATKTLNFDAVENSGSVITSWIPKPENVEDIYNLIDNFNFKDNQLKLKLLLLLQERIDIDMYNENMRVKLNEMG